MRFEAVTLFSQVHGFLIAKNKKVLEPITQYNDLPALTLLVANHTQ